MQEEGPIKNIRYGVVSYLNRIGEKDLNKYEYYESLALEFYTEHYNLKGATATNLQVMRVDVPSNFVITLPRDFETYTKVGIVVGENLHTLSVNEDLCPDTRKLSCGSLDFTEVPSEGYSFAGHFYNGVYQAMYGAGGGVSKWGSFKFDGRRKELIISQNVFQGSQLVVEYVSSGEASGDSLLPALWMDPLRKYLAMSDVEFRAGVPASTVKSRQMDFSDAMVSARSYVNQWTADEFLDVIYETSSHSFR